MGGADFKALTEATSGAVGGLLSTTILYPLDTCKTKYQAEVRSGGSTKYRSLFDVLKEAISSGQILSLYQGLSTKSLQSIISQFIYFYSYSYLKTSYLRVTKKKNMGTGANLIVAAAAGTCTAVLTQPLDTASARMQTSTFGKSKGLCATLSERSWKEAFDGLGPSLLLTSNPSIQYTVFEQIKIRLLRSQEMKNTDTDCGSSPLVLSAFTAFFLGAFSKTIATVMTYPAIRCKVMIQATEPEEDKSKMNGYHKQKPPKKMAEALRLIWLEEGAWGFYKGLHVQILKTVLSAALMLMIKEKTFKLTWIVLVAFRKWLSNTPKRLKQMQRSRFFAKNLP